MQVTVANTSDTVKVLTITVPADEFEKEYKENIKKLSKTRRIDGFRPGKIPANVAQRYFGAAAINESINTMIKINYAKALMDQKITPACPPTIDLKDATVGKDFVFEAKVDQYPEITLADLSNIEVEKVKCEIKDSDVEEMIEKVRKQQGKFEKSAEPSANGDNVVINMVGKVDGVEFEGGKADNMSVIIGSGRMIPGFEEGLIGKNIGDQFELPVKFPEDYNAENLKGKDAVFDIKVISVMKLVLPEVDENFIKNLGVKAGTLDELKVELRKNMERELSGLLRSTNRKTVLDKLVEAHPVTFSDAIVNYEAEEQRLYTIENYTKRFGKKAKVPNFELSLFKDKAINDLKLRLLFSKIVEDNKFESTEEKENELIKSFITAYESPEEMEKFYKENKNARANIKELVIEGLVVDFLFTRFKTTEVEKSFSQLIERNGY